MKRKNEDVLWRASNTEIGNKLSEWTASALVTLFFCCLFAALGLLYTAITGIEDIPIFVFFPVIWLAIYAGEIIERRKNE